MLLHSCESVLRARDNGKAQRSVRLAAAMWLISRARRPTCFSLGRPFSLRRQPSTVNEPLCCKHSSHRTSRAQAGAVLVYLSESRYLAR